MDIYKIPDWFLSALFNWLKALKPFPGSQRLFRELECSSLRLRQPVVCFRAQRWQESLLEPEQELDLGPGLKSPDHSRYTFRARY